MPTFSPPKRHDDARTTVTVTFTPEETAEAENRALSLLGREMSLPGFRKGNVPADMLREKIEPERLLEETSRLLLQNALPAVLKENDLHPIIRPRIAAVAREPLTLDITVISRPSVRWPRKGLPKIEQTDIAVDAAEVDRILDRALEQHETTTVVDRPSAMGDRVVIDFSGTDADGKPVPGTEAKEFALKLGSGSLIPGFEEALVGKSAGDAHTFTVTFPADYHAEQLRNAPVTFATTITSVAAVERPALTDAFVKEHLHADSADAFRERVTGILREQAQMRQRSEREEKLLDALVASITVTLPDELVAEETAVLFQDMAERLQQQGMTPEAWMQRTGKTLEALEKELQEDAKKRLKVRLGIESLLETNEITLTEDETKSAIEEAIAMGMQEEQAAALRSRSGELYDQVVWRKRIDKLFDQLLA